MARIFLQGVLCLKLESEAIGNDALSMKLQGQLGEGGVRDLREGFFFFNYWGLKGTSGLIL
jgi:hypothetical protein